MSRLGKNVIYNVTGQFLLVLLGFIAVRFIFRNLGADAFGLIFFALLINAVLVASLDLGISATTSREIASHMDDEREYVHSLLRTGATFYWASFVVLAAGIYLAAPLLLQRWVHLESISVGDATLVLRVLGIAALLGLPRTLYASILRGLQRMGYVNVIDVGTYGMQQLGAAVLLALGYGLPAVVTWMAACYVFGLFAYMAATLRYFPLSTLLPGYSNSAVRRNLSYSLHMMSLSILAVVLSQGNKVVVSKVMSVAAFGYFSFISTVVTRVLSVSTAVGLAAFPSFVSLRRPADRSRLLSQYGKLQDLVCYAIVPVIMLLIFGTLPVLTFVFNPAVADSLLLPMAALCLGLFMNTSVIVVYQLAAAMGRPDIANRTGAWGLLLTIPATVILTLQFGLTGAAVSTTVYFAFVYAYFIPRVFRQCLETESWMWYTHLARVSAITALTYGTVWVALAFFGMINLAGLVAGYMVATAAFLAIAYASIGSGLRGTLRYLPVQLGMRRAAVETPAK